MGLVIVPAPETKVHEPVPTAGVLPARVAVVAHTDCEGPAFEMVGKLYLNTLVVAEEDAHTPFEVVH